MLTLVISHFIGRQLLADAYLSPSTIEITYSAGQRRNQLLTANAERTRTFLIDIPEAKKQVEPAIGFGSRATRNEEMVAVRRYREPTMAFSNVGRDGRGRPGKLPRHEFGGAPRRQAIHQPYDFHSKLLRLLPKP